MEHQGHVCPQPTTPYYSLKPTMSTDMNILLDRKLSRLTKTFPRLLYGFQATYLIASWNLNLLSSLQTSATKNVGMCSWKLCDGSLVGPPMQFGEIHFNDFLPPQCPWFHILILCVHTFEIRNFAQPAYTNTPSMLRIFYHHARQRTYGDFKKHQKKTLLALAKNCRVWTVQKCADSMNLHLYRMLNGKYNLRH